jgi:transposase InsO family protein
MFIPIKIYLHPNEIEHTLTRVRRPQSNGSAERLNQTMQDEFYAVAFRKKLYSTVEEIQKDLDEFMAYTIANALTKDAIARDGRPCKRSTIDVSLIKNMFMTPWTK